MDIAQTVFTCAGTVFTAVGLGSLIGQIIQITDQVDPFYQFRNQDHIGEWAGRQEPSQWYRLKLKKPPPEGPEVTALITGFCGNSIIRMSRDPTEKPGKAGWTALLLVLHPPLEVPIPNNSKAKLARNVDSAEKGDAPTTPTLPARPKKWKDLTLKPLHRHDGSACISIERRTFIALLSIQNGRQQFSYVGPAGLRASYPAYNGIWYIEWPIGGSAVAKFSPYTQGKKPGEDPYPRFITRRVDKCIDMLAGVINIDGKQIAFPGRKGPGEWFLENEPQGYDGAHGSRLLYNILGGTSHGVAKLFQRPGGSLANEAEYAVRLDVPSDAPDKKMVHLYVRAPGTKTLLQNALDCLPWTSICWSLHRGMRDILLAYGKPTMDHYRATLAGQLRDKVKSSSKTLTDRGWGKKFVVDSMPDMAYKAVMAGVGNSGNAVRVLTGTAFLFQTNGEEDFERLDRTHFWPTSYRPQVGQTDSKLAKTAELDADAVIALTKYIVLEASPELDYQMFHQLPMELFLA